MDIKSVFKTVAPWIASALGGPLGGIAVDMATQALGVSEKTTEGLKTALAGATPADLLAIKKADQEFEAHMKELGFKNVEALEALVVADRKDARAMQAANKSIIPAMLTVILVAAFIATLSALFYFTVPEGNRDITVYMVGQLSGFTAAAIAFWLGTTRQSENKTDLLAKAQPIKE